MFPNNTMRKTGVSLLAIVAPALTFGLNYLGVGECTPEMVDAGCVGAGEIVGMVTGAVGGALFWLGQNRAEKRLNTPAPPSQ